MDYKTLIDWHCSGNILDVEDIDILETEFEKIISDSERKSLVDIAPAHICKASLISENSLWVTCLAYVLDLLKPIRIGKPRTERLFDFLCKKGIVITD